MRKILLKNAVAVGALAAAFTGLATAAQAQQNPVTSLIGRAFGFSEEQPAINYSERPPLVIPAKRDLATPGSAQALGEDPEWPKDPDEAKARKKKASADSRGPASSNSELLSQDELATGAAPSAFPNGKTGYEMDQDYRRMSNPVNPKVLSRKGSFGPQDAPLVAGQEPPRRSLTDPPTGLRKATAQVTGDEPLPSEEQEKANKPWYQKLWD